MSVGTSLVLTFTPVSSSLSHQLPRHFHTSSLPPPPPPPMLKVTCITEQITSALSAELLTRRRALCFGHVFAAIKSHQLSWLSF